MTGLWALFAYLVIADAVVSTAYVWVPVLLCAAVLGWGWGCGLSRRRRAADTSGQCPDTAPDTAEEESL